MRKAKQKDVVVVEKQKISEKLLLEAFEMAEKLGDFLSKIDNLSERSIKAKREIHLLMAPYQQEHKSIQFNAHQKKITSYFSKNC
jgi:hypothetical protein